MARGACLLEASQRGSIAAHEDGLLELCGEAQQVPASGRHIKVADTSTLRLGLHLLQRVISGMPIQALWFGLPLQMSPVSDRTQFYISVNCPGKGSGLDTHKNFIS